MYTDIFNYRARNQLGGKALGRIMGDIFESEILEIIKENARMSENRIIEKCCVVAEGGEVVEFDVGIFRKWKDKEDAPEKFRNRLSLVDPSDVEALVEVKCFADKTGYEGFRKALEKCKLGEKGYFLGIHGSNTEAKNGVNLANKPRIFIIARTLVGNIAKGREMNGVVCYNGDVLGQFLGALKNNVR